jgi:CRISPR-associated protein Cas2
MGAMVRQFYVAAYDVRDDQRLREALTVLKDYSTGGQKSVFECFLTAGERRELIRRIALVLDPADRFLLLRLDPNARFRTLGVATPPHNPSFFYFA